VTSADIARIAPRMVEDLELGSTAPAAQ
jgi:hypothetical protein